MKTDPRRLGLSHFAFYRAYLEGPEAIDIGALADRYLSCGRDPRRVRTTLRWLQDELASAARRMGDREAIRLLRLPKRLGEPEDLVADTPSLEEYREQTDPHGVFTETELLLQYRAAYPGAMLSREERRGLRLRERRLAALQRLEKVVAEAPANEHPIDTWFDPSIAARLKKVNILTLGQLVSTINGIGHRWFTKVPRLGLASAERIVTWLVANAATITPTVAERARTPLRSQSRTALLAANVSTSTITCLENLRLPETLSGAEGANRGGAERNQTGAKNDWEAIQAWLNAHPKESATWRSYRTQAERILLWSVFERGKALSSLDVADIAAYREFMKAPPAKWCAPRGIERWSPHWRPFVGPLAPSSRATAHRVLHALFAWLVAMRYLDFNPWIGNKLTGEEKDAANAKALHALTREQFAFLSQFAHEARDLAWGQRANAMLILAYATGLRLSELCAARLGHLETKWVDDEIGMAWTLRVKGKGSRTRIVPVPGAVMEALTRYLGTRGLPTEATYWEAETPVIAGLTPDGRHRDEPLTALGLARAFKRIFMQAAGHLRQTDPNGARRLEEASTHWLRHTYGTHMIEAGMPLDIVQDNMGHASSATTSRYVTTELNRRIRAAERFLKRQPV